MEPILRAAGNTPELRDLRYKRNRGQEITSLNLNMKSLCIPSRPTDFMLRKKLNALLMSSKVKIEQEGRLKWGHNLYVDEKSEQDEEV